MEPELKAATGGRAVFQTLPRIRIKLVVDGTVLSGRKFSVRFDGEDQEVFGETDGDGFAEFDLPTKQKVVVSYWGAAAVPGKREPDLKAGRITVSIGENKSRPVELRFSPERTPMGKDNSAVRYRAIQIGAPQAVALNLWARSTGEDLPTTAPGYASFVAGLSRALGGAGTRRHRLDAAAIAGLKKEYGS